MSNKIFPIIISGLIFLQTFSCKPIKSIFSRDKKDDDPAELAEQNWDSLYTDSFQSGNTIFPATYNPSATKLNDILHMSLQVSFDFNTSRLFGQAMLDIKPWAYDTDSLYLDAKEFDIGDISLVEVSGARKTLSYKYDGKRISIGLDRKYKRSETYKIFIQYTANPEKVSQKGSEFISEAKGLYFINPKGENPTKPIQIWTQGETESNSCWFPTIDKPNEKITHEISITVPSKFKTLSNGLMIGTKSNPDGSRTDIWKMDKPHAPYLVMMAIGDYAVVKDKWRNIPVEYYVEKEFEPYAKNIFGKTPEMIEFFSKKLGVDFPWQKYAEVVVRDYVSGAMENTTATVFGEFMQKNPSKMLDDHDMENESVVAHELFHHWFGDLVTCESWANLPLNESFATFGEYLWFEYKYGRDFADYHYLQDVDTYLGEAISKKKNLIRFDYLEREDMFDRHSYQKGGSVLHLLRKYLGDEVFFESLKVYLEANRFQSAEIHDLRLAIEKVSGEDLNWFFNQWFLGKGHPELSAEHQYVESTGNIVLELNQGQDYSESGLFRIPLDIDIYEKGQVKRVRIFMDSISQSFRIPVSSKPSLVIVDAERSFLGTLKQSITFDEAAFQLLNAPRYADRLYAIEKLIEEPENPQLVSLLKVAMKDSFWNIRVKAIDALEVIAQQEGLSDLKSLLIQISTNDSKSIVRANAIRGLCKLFPGDTALTTLYRNAISDSSQQVQIAAINSMYISDPEGALQYFSSIEQKSTPGIQFAIAMIYSYIIQPDKFDFIKSVYEKLTDQSEKYYLASSIVEYAVSQGYTVSQNAIPFFENIYAKETKWWMKYQGILGLKSIMNSYLDAIKTIDSEIDEARKNKSAGKEIAEKENQKSKFNTIVNEVQLKLNRIEEENTDENLSIILRKTEGE